jgi:hypothetical protein
VLEWQRGKAVRREPHRDMRHGRVGGGCRGKQALVP